MSKTNPKVDGYFRYAEQWQAEFEKLRKIVLSCSYPLTEAMKWGHPCYLSEGTNIVLMHGFKEYCALLFFKGALLKDVEGVLVQQTKNTQSARQIRFTSVKEITAMKSTVKAYIEQAIEVEKSGLKVKFKKTEEFEFPEEFQEKLDADPALQKAFDALTPGRQKGYILHFSGAKQSKTRTSRVEKCIPRILDGKGLDD